MARKTATTSKTGRAAAGTSDASQLSRDGSSLAENIYWSLREEVTSGQMKPGSRVTETEVAQRFGMSRTPVREALKRLQQGGFLEDTPDRGLIVSNPSLTEILDAYLIRERLEGLAARLAAERAHESDLMYLALCYEKLTTANLETQPVIDFSNKFTFRVFAAAYSPNLTRLIEAARGVHFSAMRANMASPERRIQSIKERGEILEAIQKRDPAAAEAAMQRHLQSARDFRMAMAVRESI